jgi:hypothetical protein
MDDESKEGRSQTDALVDGMDFGELCNEFECVSSPSVEATARQVARDILELRQDNRAFNCYVVSVKYKVPTLMSCKIYTRTFLGKKIHPWRLCLILHLLVCICLPSQCFFFRTRSGHLLGVRST